MTSSLLKSVGLAAVAWCVISPAQAQEAGSVFVKAAAARTKLVDKGTIKTDGVVDPAADYTTRDAYHGVVTFGWFPIDHVALEGSISTPATTNNVPAGSLAGVPNLGDDEFTVVTLGGSVHPFKGRFSPYIGGGIQMQFTTQERDGLGVGLNIPNSHGPYIHAGVNYRVGKRWGVFADVKKAFYHTNATGLLPLDATFTNFAAVDAKAELDPLTIQLGLVAHFGGSGDESDDAADFSTDDSNWMIRAGFSTLSLADKLDLKVGGVPFPNSALSTFEHYTPSLQVGRFLTRHIAVNATVGLPPHIDVYGGGSIGALPKLGEVTYGPTALTLQYHPWRTGRIRPYVGVGASYMIVFDADDGAFESLKVSNDLAPALEIGTDIMVDNQMGLFLDVKKAFLRPSTTGTFQGATVEGQTRLDPWVFSAGVSYRFR